jgi:hypothetical protein
MTERLLAASSKKRKPTVRITCRFKTTSGSTIKRQLLEREREKAVKALRLIGT